MMSPSITPVDHSPGCSPHSRPEEGATFIVRPPLRVEWACGRERGLERAAWLNGSTR